MQGHVTDQQTRLSEALKRRAAEEGFNPVGIARIPGSPRLQLRTTALQRWLDHGHQADMAWMAAPRRRDPRLLLDGANS
ncbi:MAG: epoxyqueuosine reductase, partial [Cyanobacteriota bacterium]|nr:epoxyqueuosine reductase [Cyanobacteriota bacterium]